MELSASAGSGEPSPCCAASSALVSRGQSGSLYSGTMMPVVAGVWVGFRPEDVGSGFASIRFSRAAILREPRAGSWPVDFR
ncbi:hypothetical protein BIV23_30225 [Streptomyces monashensis]|uniref:Uncharacterized protein n=1 Tax=Streptomyces monashensis TaxID=1678012 RepID=A0A1S2PXC9_9ACTN|nr:hypothetical protein BIV23_30225 [Streptomyces monashensis]